MREEPCGSHHVAARALKWEISSGLTEREDGEVRESESGLELESKLEALEDELFHRRRLTVPGKGFFGGESLPLGSKRQAFQPSQKSAVARRAGVAMVRCGERDPA